MPRAQPASSFGPALLGFFDRLYIINLPERRDRRRQMRQQLRAVGLDFDHPQVTLFPGRKVAAADGFPTVGAHGCFLSHLAVLKEARDRNLARVLIAEDDLDFQPQGRDPASLLQPLDHRRWDLFFAAYHFPERFTVDGIGLVDLGQRYRISGCHFYAVPRHSLEPLIGYLEAALAGPAPKPHLDVAVSAFRSTVPDCSTLVASPALGFQRRSRSNIQQLAFYDRLPLMQPVADSLRRLIGRRRS